MSGAVRPRWKPFLDEHARLRGPVGELREVGDLVGEAPSDEIRRRLAKLHGFLSHELLPHIVKEEQVLYRAIERVEGLRGAANTLRRDHAAIAGLVRELASVQDQIENEELGREAIRDLRRILYGMFTLITVHMGKDDEVCLPALDRALSGERIRMLVEELEFFGEAGEAAW